MEYTYFVNDLTDIDLIENSQKKLQTNIGLSNKTEAAFSRIYFGNEFCHFLIPNVNTIDKVFDYCTEHKYKISYVTPIVPEQSIPRIENILEYIIKKYNSIDIEFVFNDWGIFYLLKNKYGIYNCVAGRILDKTLRDARVSDYELFSKEGLAFLRRPSITAISYQKMLEKYNIGRVELDILPQGFDINKEELHGISLSLYFPFGIVTTGRQCMMRMLDRELGSKFIIDNKCSYNCRKYDQEMKANYREKDGQSNELILYRKGNTIFYNNSGFLKSINMNIFDRIIYQPRMQL